MKEFKRENRNGRYVYVKRLAFGGEVHKAGDEFAAFDKNGNCLGEMFRNQEQAEESASTGEVDQIYQEDVSDLDLWPLWNRAVECEKVYLADDGTQIVYLKNDIFMTAVNGEWGYEVELITDVDLDQRYGKDDRGGYHLRFCPKNDILVLE